MRVLETQRLYLREMEQTDYAALSKILQDKETMYAYEHAFDTAETQEWLDRQRRRYREDGFGLWAAVYKQTDEMIGQCGLTWQTYDGKQVLEIGYLFQRAFWHQGFASEAAIACKAYAFETLKAEEVFSIIRDTNFPSQRVARRNGMTVKDAFIKRYYGIEMPHLVFSVRRCPPDGAADNENSVLAV